MKNLSQNVFVYSGKKYTFSAVLSNFDNTLQRPLDNNDIEVFEYSNEVNKLYLYGRLIVTDCYGKVDKFLQQQYPFCYITFVQHEQSFDGMFSTDKYSDTNAFYCKFYIDSFLILDRNGPNIKYELKLVSENIFRCISNVDYTNYDKDPESLFEIIKACIQKTDSKINPDSFKNITTAVKINYATQCNDNLLTTVKYLLNKLYYYQIRDNSIKMLWYNETEVTYNIFDTKNKYTKAGTYPIVVSLLNSNNEGLIEQEPTKISTIAKFPTLDSIMAMKDHIVYDYDFNSNTFHSDNSIKTDEIVDYANNTIQEENIEKRSIPVSISTLKYENFGSYWNNDFKIYDSVMKTLLGNNALVLNTSGDILRKPTSYINVCIDRGSKNINSSDDIAAYKEKLTRYQGLEGTWFATRVTHIIEPIKAKYRQNIAMSRNFLPKFS